MGEANGQAAATGSRDNRKTQTDQETENAERLPDSKAQPLSMGILIMMMDDD